MSLACCKVAVVRVRKIDAVHRFDVSAFRLTGNKVPVDHGYALCSAISRIVQEIHEAENIGAHPVRGIYSGNGELMLRVSSRLVVRMDSDEIASCSNFPFSSHSFPLCSRKEANVSAKTCGKPFSIVIGSPNRIQFTEISSGMT